MGRMSYSNPGTSFKKVECMQCKKEVTRRGSIAVNPPMDGQPTGRTEKTGKLWMSNEHGGREITSKGPSPRVCKGGCSA